jgi:transposase
MSDLFWLSDVQLARLEPYFPNSNCKPRVDDRRVFSGIIFIKRNGLQWRDALKEHSPHKTLYNRWKRWSDKGIFAQMMMGLAAGHGKENTVMIPLFDCFAIYCRAVDVTYLQAHRRQKGRHGRLIGRTKGGMNTKLHAICAVQGRPIIFFGTAGQVRPC